MPGRRPALRPSCAVAAGSVKQMRPQLVHCSNRSRGGAGWRGASLPSWEGQGVSGIELSEVRQDRSAGFIHNVKSGAA